MPSRAEALLEGRPLVVATGNPKKAGEIRAVLGPLGVAVETLADLAAAGAGPFEDPVEDRDTFEGNAELKAASYAEQTGRVVLADDSGLEVDALGGAPGVISARYASRAYDAEHGEGAFAALPRERRDVLNLRLVLRSLEKLGVEADRRTARFVCSMSLGIPSRSPTRTPGPTVRGVMEGRIGVPPRVPAGEHGFGYDPIFLVGPSHNHTGAQLDPDEKNRLSHRGDAARQIAGLLSEEDPA